MKTKKLFILMASAGLMLGFTTACEVVRVGHKSNTTVIQTNPNGQIPPGQLKKATGAKSAKNYAPGQNKKGKKSNNL